jgi:hypothetical protein
MSALDTAASRYDDAVQRLIEVIKVIEDIPATNLPGDHSHMANRLLAEAYDLYHALTAARDALTWG